MAGTVNSISVLHAPDDWEAESPPKMDQISEGSATVLSKQTEDGVWEHSRALVTILKGLWEERTGIFQCMTRSKGDI